MGNETTNVDLRRGLQLRRVPILKYEVFASTAMTVYHDHKMKVATFEPQTLDDDLEALRIVAFLLAGLRKQRGPVDWNTVPRSIARHFRLVG